MSKEKEMTIETLTRLREEIRAEAERKMDDLTRAIEILMQREANPDALLPFPPTPSRSNGTPSRSNGVPSVTNMLRIVANGLAGPERDEIFTFAQLKSAMIERWSGEEKKIRGGIYPAVKQLVTADEFEQLDHGLRLGPKYKATEE